MIAPQIEAMSKEMADVVFLKVDVDENEDAAQEYNISAMPTFIFIKNQAKVSSFYFMQTNRFTFENFWIILFTDSNPFTD